jgi:hypothetical protein
MSYVDMPSMGVPKVDLSSLIAPEEEGKTYIGPNINWAEVPSNLLNLLALLDTTQGLLPGPVGVIPKFANKAEPFWASPGNKQFMKSIKALFRLEERDPINKELFGKARLTFDKPGGSAASTHIGGGYFRVAPDKAFTALPTELSAENAKRAKKYIQDYAKELVGHEKRHWWMRDPEVFKKTEELYHGAPKEVKEAVQFSEFLPYSWAASIKGEKSAAPIARQLAQLAKENPKVKNIIEEVAKLKPKSSQKAMEAIETARKHPFSFSKMEDYSKEDIFEAIKDAQERIVQTNKGGGILGSRKTPARRIELEPPTPKEVAKEALQKRNRMKEVIISEPNKTVSVAPMYSGPKQATRDFIDDIVKNIKNPNVRAKAIELLEKRLLD